MVLLEAVVAYVKILHGSWGRTRRRHENICKCLIGKRIRGFPTKEGVHK
jgi:hypothetical protein